MDINIEGTDELNLATTRGQMPIPEDWDLEAMASPGKFRPKNLAKLPEKLKKNFDSSLKMELSGLLNSGTFEKTPITNIPPNPRIFRSRFVDELRRAESGVLFKSRLVAQNYGYEDSADVATKAPTVQRFSQRIMFSLAASSNEMKPFLRDITHAYTQSRNELERDVFIRPPPELQLDSGIVLKVLKQLYGIPEPVLHWYLTYIEHHLTRLGMTRSAVDLGMLIRRNGNKLLGVISLQVDDSLGFGVDYFLQEEETAVEKFKHKARQTRGLEPSRFNGLQLSRMTDGAIHVRQKEKILKLQIAKRQKDFARNRALAQ